MSKMNELDLAAKELRKAAKSLNAAADSLTAFSGEAETTAEVPTPSTVALEEVRAVLAEKSRAGHTNEVRELLVKGRHIAA